MHAIVFQPRIQFNPYGLILLVHQAVAALVRGRPHVVDQPDVQPADHSQAAQRHPRQEHKLLVRGQIEHDFLLFLIHRYRLFHHAG